MGDARAFDMTPSDAVNPGWHSFVLHTQAYAAWCDEQFGFFLGHEPKATVRTRPLIGSVVDRVRTRPRAAATAADPLSLNGSGPAWLRRPDRHSQGFQG
ncbi:hypothetical protein ACFYM2_13045 [Streptomyces sp. NPDC006711]|uniref:hypothetical protein n=1 Tax=Streptomyces sp. NPDC006711 TaxID=3364762 RepID=UPI00367D29F0